MTKSTITRERLQELAEGQSGFNLRIATHEESQELARIALAALDTEPVGEFYEDGPLNWYQISDGDRVPAHRRIPLYRHAQPAPVVPNGLRVALSNAGIAAPESDEMLAATCEKHIQALVTWVKDRKPFQSAPVVPSFEEWLSAANRNPLGWVKDAMREAYDACRAAMLAAAPQSPGGDHATVPGKWIPVSEQMPEVGDIVLAAMGGAVIVSETECTATGLRFFTSVISGRELPATHWMPLSAVPQEVR